MDYSSGSGVAATQTAVLYLPRGRCRCLRRCLCLVVKAAEAVGAETLAGSFARPIRRRNCGQGRGGTGGRAIYRQRRPQGSCDDSGGRVIRPAETVAELRQDCGGWQRRWRGSVLSWAASMTEAEPPGVWYVRRCQVKKRGAV